MLKEFIIFLKQYGVIGLTIAVIIGGKLNLLITGLVNDLFTQLLFQPALKAAGIDKITDLAYNGILYGKVVSALIDFVIVAFIVFVLAKKAMKEELVSKE